MTSIGKTSLAKFDPIWGLDNEWGALHALERLETLAPDAASRERTRALTTRVRAIEAWRPFTPDDLPRFISGADSTDFDSLRSAFSARAGSEAAFLIDALETSNRVFLNNRAAGQGAPAHAVIRLSGAGKESWPNATRSVALGRCTETDSRRVTATAATTPSRFSLITEEGVE